ncbi:hypothetical protein ACFSQP_09335 [Bizionia sediminis]|uniref:Uncharacterized protein n=1 Tax=Bizionia sediminis TaxID=1737064 RepID=A0ABW5KUM6_9FLAO
MATIKVTRASSVQSIKRQFSKEFSCNIRIYNGARFANEKEKISDLSKTEDPGGTLELGPRSRVGNVEDYFMQKFGIKVQVSNADDSKLANDKMTLNQAGKL